MDHKEEIQLRDNRILRLEKEIEKLKKSIKVQKYGLVWADVPEAFEDDFENKLPVLEEVPKLAIKSKDEKPTHILIEGDNYHALTCLNYTHKSKIDVIYIDPPYNTGSDGFRYKDKRFLDKYPDGTEVPKDHPFRHSYWLSFMKKRLELAKDLLSQTGMLFISIDDNEYAQLKLLCDDIFDESNFVATFKWNRTAKAPSLSNSVRTKYEYVLCYKKQDTIKLYGKDSYNTEAPLLHLPNKQAELVFPIGSLKVPQSFDVGTYSEKYKVELLDNLIERDGFNANQVKIKGCFAWSQRKVDQYLRDGHNFLVKKSLSTIYYYMGDNKSFIAPSDLLSFEECGVKKNTDANTDMQKLGISFTYSKPVSLVEYLVKIATYDKKDAIILDFFAGSGTTGHAVLNLNITEQASRQFILITNNEGKIMTEVCHPRIKKVIDGFGENPPLGGSVRYYRTGFVGKHNILDADDKDKVQLAYHAGEMLSIAENTLETVEKTDYWQIFEGRDSFTAVYFREEYEELDAFIAKVKKLKKPVSVYVFSWEDDPYVADFDDIPSITVKTIPQPILEIYKQIYNLV